MYKLTLAEVQHLLETHNLLQKVPAPSPNVAQTFTHLSYDSRDVTPQTLFFCKGAKFHIRSLKEAEVAGVTTFLSEVDYPTHGTLLLVTDIQVAMAVIASHFYQQPQAQLKLIGITGTKGKTTTAYFVHSILNHTFPQQVALFSSEETCVNGRDFKSSTLTTPEALVLYQQLAQAVESGLTHVVMEVSSQAYKTKRVFGLTFDIGIFLNISPDHISPVEHATFEEYFDCKKQLLYNSRSIIFNQDSLLQDEDLPTVSRQSYGRTQGDFRVHSLENTRDFSIQSQEDQLTQHYGLSMLGEFNHENAAAAILASQQLGATEAEIRTALLHAHVPGRMNLLEKHNGAFIFIDYAHNYLSISSLGKFAKKLRPHGRLIFVTGSVGGKALSRRADIGAALSEYADVIFLTSDDPDFEQPQAIANEIAATVKSSMIPCSFIEDRQSAVQQAIQLAHPEDTVLLIGKGTEQSMKVKGKQQPYLGDFDVALPYTKQ